MKILNSFLLSGFAFLLTFCSPQSPSATSEGSIEGVNVSVDYSSPRVKGRQGKIWGDMLPYGEVWRAGANAATEVTFDQPVMVEGERLDAGTYSLFMIPGEQDWTVIFNAATGISGTEYESVKDQNVLEVSVQPQKNSDLREELNYEVTDGELRLNWEYLTIPLDVQPA
ncbi:hypothetical protein OKW21_000330 [Catalinimonas alkaloidigena]|uniref:DUF2911 domain-containing protein n=1 Tax=Catalinimonas alkaloidigena TaxID=1075417 RepID=UPI0024071223|nr:DUF2911 domain-containing protein [Catalinimonas alkaloidigena]MDF9795067.1 hypothetical protein [Catalinimonas alkaloidigena]